MNDQPLVSIIVPIYNVSEYLKQCLDSCINQTYSNLEIIAVNDGSTDDSLDIINQFQQEDLRVRIIDKVNGGLNSARKAGIDSAGGQYFTILDGDDYLESDAIENLYQAAISSNADIVLGSCNMVIAENGEYHGKQVFRNESFDRDQYIRRILTEGPNTVCMKIYKKNIIPDDARYPDIAAGQDFPLTLQWAFNINKVVYTDTIVYNYIVAREDSTMGGDRSKRVEGSFHATYFVFNYLREKQKLDNYELEIVNGFGAKLYSYLSNKNNRFLDNKHKIIEINNYLWSKRKSIDTIQLKVFVWLLKLSVYITHWFVVLAQKYKPSLNPFTS